MSETLVAVVHGESGAGKSYFGGTVPTPALVLEAEGGSRFVKALKPTRRWDPLTEAPPVDDGTFKSVFVDVLDWPTLDAAYRWLASGQHPFKSVILDSLTEAQKRLVDKVAGTEQPTLQDWGIIGRHFEDMVRKFRDLYRHPTNPLNVLLLCLTHERDNERRPFLKGQIELTLPAFVDVVAYLSTEQGPSGNVVHKMQIVPLNNIIAKDRTGVLVDKYGPYIIDANFTEWLKILDAEFGAPAATTTEVTTP